MYFKVPLTVDLSQLKCYMVMCPVAALLDNAVLDLPVHRKHQVAQTHAGAMEMQLTKQDPRKCFLIMNKLSNTKASWELRDILIKYSLDCT